MIKSLALFKNTAIYLTANVINAAIPFALIPVLTNYLSPEEYGIIALYTLFVSFITPFIGLSVHGAITRKYFSLNRIDFRQYIGNCLYIVLISLILFIVIISFLGTPISYFSGLPEDILYPVVLISFFQYITLILLSILQVKEKSIQYGILQIGVSLLNFGLSYLFLVKYLEGWRGRLLAWEYAAGSFAIISFLIILIYQKAIFKFKISFIKDILNFSLPLIPHTVGGLIIALSDRLIISKILGLNETGIYTISFQISSILLIVLTSFNSAYVPWLFNKLKINDKKINIQIVVMSYYFMVCILLMVVIGYLISPIFFEFFVGEGFREGSKYLFWMLLCFGLNGMYFLVSNYIFYANKTKFLAATTFFIAIINVPICYFFTKKWGLMGSVQSSVLSWFLLFLITWALSNRVYNMPWKIGFFEAIKFKMKFRF
ncbi:lipopolysaccharide biosynthesis protein [Pedobacter frigoris]|uniref:Flippase n=1 Tax=Pedobacter frigoris TaxID=2571272 RepID=A0A4U1CE51_9SPHI|nr:oligosaccharide flippase family protein [Pedobacter frigoris]TKC05268.1 flippase [Pedobacter frigoris]